MTRGDTQSRNPHHACSPSYFDILYQPMRMVLGCITLLLVFMPGLAQGHPHAWIDLRSTIVFTADKRVGSIAEEWLFDKVYTAFIVDEVPADQRQSKEALTRLAGKNLGNLKTVGYFTDIEGDGKPVSVGDVTEYASEMRDGRLWMRFVLPLVTALDPRAHTLSFSIADPTYWIEMLQQPKVPIALEGPGANGCTAKIEWPHPSAAAVARALAQDNLPQADPTVGKLFAQTVVLKCPS